MSQFLHDNDDTKTIAIPWFFSENSPAKNEKRCLPSVLSQVPSLYHHGDLLGSVILEATK